MTFSSRSRLLIKEFVDLQGYWRTGLRLPSPEGFERKVRYQSGPWQYFLTQQPITMDPAVKVIFFHGGAWTFGRPERFRHHGHFFVRRGLESVLPTVRRLPFFHGKHLRSDLIAFLKQLDQSYGPEVRWILGGVSSGGHLASLLATDPSIASAANWHPERFLGLLLIAPPLDLDQMPYWVRMALNRAPSGISSSPINPMNFVLEHPKLQVLLAQGSQDPIVKSQAVLPWIKKRKETYPERTQWIKLKGKGHIDLVSWSFPGSELEPIFSNWLEEIR